MVYYILIISWICWFFVLLYFIKKYLETKKMERIRSEFISVVSHQLRTPLSAIRWHLEMILAGERGEIVNEGQKESLNYIYESNQKLIDVLENLLMAMDIEAKKIVLRQEAVQLRDLISKIIEKYEKNIKEKRINLELKILNKIPEISLDEFKINYVLKNLISNAIRYNKENGKLMIKLEKKEKEILVNIEDEGIGIPKYEKESAFEKFFRGTNAVRFSPGGIGLGLFIAKAFIKAHGGEIWFESEENKGSKFYFTLPIK